MASSHKPIPDRIRWQLKAATRDLLDRSGGGRRAESITGVSDSHLSRCGDPENDSLLGLAALIHLEADVGRPIVTEFLASLSGHRLVPVDGAAAGGSVSAAFAGTVGCVSGLITKAAEALADDVLTEAERREIAAAAPAAKEAIDGLVRSVAASPARLVPRRS